LDTKPMFGLSASICIVLWSVGGCWIQYFPDPRVSGPQTSA